MNPVFTYWEGSCPFTIRTSLASVSSVYGKDHIHLDPSSLGEYVDIPSHVLGLQSVALRSDFIRTALLQRYGGTWLDADILLKRPVPEVDRIMLWEEGGKPIVDDGPFRDRPELCIGIIVAPSYHPLMSMLLERFDKLLNDSVLDDGSLRPGVPRYVGQRLWRDLAYGLSDLAIGKTTDFHLATDAAHWYEYWDGTIRWEDCVVGAHWFFSAHQNLYEYPNDEIASWPSQIQSLESEIDVRGLFPQSVMAGFIENRKA